MNVIFFPFFILCFVLLQQRWPKHKMIPACSNFDSTLFFTCNKLQMPEWSDMYYEWTSYRLADALGQWYFDKKNYTRKTLLKEYQSKWGNQTIVSRYYSKTKSKQFDPQLLFEITQSSLPIENQSNHAVQHIRLGDTACIPCWYTPRRHKHSKKMYVFPKQYYEHIYTQFQYQNVTTIIITASTTHADLDSEKRKQNIKDSALLILTMKHFWQQMGFKVYTRIDCGTPDEDFMFMINAPIFIQGGGGYSQLIADMVRRNNGTVIYDKEFLKKLLLEI